MSMTELKMSFPTEKLDALRFFMGQKEQSIEKELQEYLDKTYEKMVPVQVRNYLENRMEPASTSEQTQTGQQTSALEQPHTDLHVPDEQQIPVKKQEDNEIEKITAAKDHPVRSTRRQKEQSKMDQSDQSVAPETAAEAGAPDAQEESQGMSMNM